MICIPETAMRAETEAERTNKCAVALHACVVRVLMVEKQADSKPQKCSQHDENKSPSERAEKATKTAYADNQTNNNKKNRNTKQQPTTQNNTAATTYDERQQTSSPPSTLPSPCLFSSPPQKHEFLYSVVFNFCVFVVDWSG